MLYRNLLVFSILLFMFACIQDPPPEVQQKPTFPKPPKARNKPTEVVMNFLDALKAQDYSTAFDYIYIINIDREGYIIMSKNAAESRGLKILNYKLLGTQIFKDTAIVVSLVDVSYKPLESKERVERTSTQKYDLTLIDEYWKITKEECLENCYTEPSDPTQEQKEDNSKLQ